MRLRRGLVVWGMALLGATPIACSPPPTPDVLIVTFDTTRYDRIGPSGYSEANTPTLDALAAEGLVFDRAFSVAGITLPAHTTIFTGVEPLEHGVRNNGRFVVPNDMETLAEYLRSAGYETAAFVSAFVLDSKFNLGQGFDVYSDESRKDGGNPFDLAVAQRPGEEVTDDAIEWLDELDGSSPFLLWAHYYDPHFPRTVEPPFDQMLDDYDAEIAYTDAAFGRLLAAVREARDRDLWIVFTSDHGEAFGDHGEPTHAVLAYDSTLHVPLILVGPGVPKGERSDTFVRHVDILPTLLEAVDLSVPSDLPGRSLLAAYRDGDGEDGSVVSYFESANPKFEYGWAEVNGVRTARWKYTAAPSPPELYDTLADPGEIENLIDAEPEVGARMAAAREKLHAERSTLGDEETRARPQLSADELEQLAALGYVEAPGDFQAGQEPDPRRFVRALNLINGARGYARRGSYARALASLEPLAESPILRPIALRELAPIYREQHRYDDAIDAYREHLALTGSILSLNELARTLLLAERFEDVVELAGETEQVSRRSRWFRAQALTALGRHTEARAEVDKALPRERERPQALRARAMLALQSGPLPDGEQELRSLLAEAPENALLQSILGFHLAIWGRPEQRDEATLLLASASESGPDNPEVLSHVGWARIRVGLLDEGIANLEKAVELDEERHLDRIRLAQALTAKGELERALGLFRRSLAEQPEARWAPDARSAARALRSEIARLSAEEGDA